MRSRTLPSEYLPNPQTIHLHLGAHKTATTRLQKILLHNRGLLTENGVHYEGPEHIREQGWWRHYRGYVDQTNADVRKQKELALKKFQPKKDLWLVSEENLVGYPRDIMAADSMYPKAGALLAAFCSLFPSEVLKIFFGIRSYDSYLTSRYLEVVRNDGYLYWDKFLHSVNLSRLSWVKMIEIFAEHAATKNIRVWQYEHHCELEHKILQSMTGIHNSQVFSHPYGERKVRVSMSATALSKISELGKMNREEWQVAAEETVAKYSDEDGLDKFDPWTSSEKKSLRDRYQSDLSQIQARFPALQLLAPKGDKIDSPLHPLS